MNYTYMYSFCLKFNEIIIETILFKHFFWPYNLKVGRQKVLI